MEQVDVSIIVPVYNIEQYLDRCIESLINQTYKNYEIILVNDGSEDHSGEICEKWRKRHEKVKVFHIANHGVSYARNFGIENCRGRYLTFVDGDDWIDKNMVLALKNLIEEDNADIALCNILIDYKNGISLLKNEYKIRDQSFKKDNAEELLKLWSPCAKLYKREVIGEIRFPQLKCAEDLMFIYQLIIKDKIEKIVATNKGLYHYFQRENSAMHTGFKEEWYVALQKEIEVAKALEDRFHEILQTNLVKNGAQLFLSGYSEASFKSMLNYRKLYKLYRKEIKKYKKYIFCTIKTKREKIRLFFVVFYPSLYIILKKINKYYFKRSSLK